MRAMTFSSLSQVLAILLAVLLAWGTIERLASERDSARAERDSAVFERDGLREAARITGERLAIAAGNDRKHTKELTDALNSNKALRRAIELGDRRLYVNASCPAAPADSGTGAGGLVDAGPAQLATNARSDYFTLLDQLALSRQMILGLQDHIHSFCPTPTHPGAHHEQ